MKTANMLLEIGTEEIPAAFLPGALENLEALTRQHLEAAGYVYQHLTTLGTPRRLTVSVTGLPVDQPDREDVIVGPPGKVAFTPDGTPTKAAEGFARANGVDVSALRLEDTERGPYVVLRRTVPGRPTREILQEILPAVAVAMPFPKTMRWGEEELRFVRPIRWLVALFGEDVVPFAPAGVESGRESQGHRFMAPGPVAVSSDLEAYKAILKEKFVVVDPDLRRKELLSDAHEAATAAGGALLPDDALVSLNADLTELPSAVCGTFEERFLELPREVLITSMREHQKYFAVVDGEGRLMPNFVAINNTRSPRPEVVRKGHERVLRARLSDALFFFDEDRKEPLDAFVADLSGVVFHQKLGTLMDKTKRVQALARYLANLVAPGEISFAERAAWLCKADLLTGMVGEFPTLQGIMGGEYARHSGETPQVATAISEHYRPVRAGGELPASMTGAVLSITDKMDTICGTFAIGLEPSGTADPYALRRLALGIMHILEDKGLDLSLKALTAEAIFLVGERVENVPVDCAQRVMAFFERRFVHDMLSKGFVQDVVEAAVRASFDDVVDCVRRIEALTAVRGMPEFEPLSVAFKRVMNILKDYEGGAVRSGLLVEADEKALYEGYLAVEEGVRDLLVERDYEKALMTLLTLKPVVDRFFETVLVMAKDPGVRNNRLALLWQISRLFLEVGDLSAIAVTGG